MNRNKTYRWQALDASMLDSDNKRRLSCVLLLQVQPWICEWHEKADNGDTADVEQEDTDVNTLDRLRKVATGVLSLSSSNLTSSMRL